jgi:hypothetical protein
LIDFAKAGLSDLGTDLSRATSLLRTVTITSYGE